MLYRVRKRIKNTLFYYQTKRLVDTAPLEYREAPLCIVSMVAELDVQMYILAVKALYRRLGRGKIVSILDHDVTQRSRDLIKHHFGGGEFLRLAELDPGECQRGGTWERLVYCINRSAEEYVIQIDSDVLCFGPIPEVERHISENRAFALGEGLSVKPLCHWPAEGNAWETCGGHIVRTFEQRAAEFPEAGKWLYLRGSSGFAGFAKGALRADIIEMFHRGGELVHGGRWREWGTEQLASNFAVANSPGGAPLPHPKYATYVGQEVSSSGSLLHFIGTWRFDQGVFRFLANREIDAMLSRGSYAEKNHPAAR